MNSTPNNKYTWLVRHGETEENKSGILQGQKIPGVLTLEGKESISELAKKILLNGRKIARIYTSDLSRAKMSADIMAKFFQCPVILDPRLRQRCWGQVEGSDGSNIAKDFNPYLSDSGDGRAAPDVEPLALVNNRLKDFISDVVNRDEGDIVVISHCETVSYLLDEILGQGLIYYASKQSEAHLLIHNSSNNLLSYELFKECGVFPKPNGKIVAVMADAQSFLNAPSGVNLLSHRGYQAILESELETSQFQAVAAVINGDSHLGQKELSKYPHLSVVSRYGSGIDGIDLAYLKKRHITLCNVACNERAVAEYIISAILAEARELVTLDPKMKTNCWSPSGYGTEWSRITLGIVGLGRIGKELARLAVPLGFKVVAFDRKHSTGMDFCKKNHIKYVKEISELYRRCNYISINLSLNPSAKSFVGEDAFQSMAEGEKPFLINTSRSGVVDSAALLKALQEAKISGAAIDVWPSEENPQNMDEVNLAIMRHPKVIATPHVAGKTLSAVESARCLAAQNIDWALSGHRHIASICNQE